MKQRQSRVKNKKRNRKEESERYRETHCSTIAIEEKIKFDFMELGFRKRYALTEMRNALANQDWTSLQQMFGYLFESSYVEPIVWRYAFLIFLCSPVSDQSHLQEFIEMCLGFNVVENGILLEQLFSLQERTV